MRDGVVAVAEGSDLRSLARNLVAFFRNESCGKCVPCRDGTEKATALLERAVATGEAIDMEVMEKLNLLLTETSICGLGYVALNPLISVAKHWPEEVPGEEPVVADEVFGPVAVLDAYEDFCDFRRRIEGAAGRRARISREDWLKNRRAELQSRMRRRKRKDRQGVIDKEVIGKSVLTGDDDRYRNKRL